MVGLTLVNSVRDFESVYDGMGIRSLIMSHQRRHSVQGAFLLCDVFFPVTCSNHGGENPYSDGCGFAAGMFGGCRCILRLEVTCAQILVMTQ